MIDVSQLDRPEFGRLLEQAMHARRVNHSQLAARLTLATGDVWTPTAVRHLVLGGRTPTSPQVEQLIGVLAPELDADAARAAAGNQKGAS